LTRDEALRLLQERSIPVNTWAKPTEKEVAHPFVERQRALLKQIQGVLEEQIAKDTEMVSELRVGLAKIEKARALRGEDR
jgi:hypothetical protein